MTKVKFFPGIESENKHTQKHVERAESVLGKTSDLILEMRDLVQDLEEDDKVPEDERKDLMELTVIGFLKVLTVEIGSDEKSQKRLERVLFEAFSEEEKNPIYA